MQIPDHPFTFGMNGRLTLRKGVYTTYAAFVMLRERHGADFDAHLLLKTVNPVFPPAFEPDPNVHVIMDQSLPEDLRQFYWSIDSLVCPSWAEAKHLPPIEALGCGTPVIVSDIVGHRTWATPDIATLVPTTTKTLMLGYEGGCVEVEDLADAMWDHYTNRQAQRQKALLGSRMLPAMLDWSKCVERLTLALDLRL